MGKKRKRKASKSKIRIFLTIVVFGFITVALGYNCLSNILKIQESYTKEEAKYFTASKTVSETTYKDTNDNFGEQIFILLFMVMMHIVDDYYLQGILAKMKQKSWWEENAPNKLYRKDYLMALFMHSFSWAFSIMLPLAIYFKFQIGISFLIILEYTTIPPGTA